MTRIKMMVLTAGVWVLAAGSAAALTLDLNRPPVPQLGAPDVHTAAPETVRHADVEAQPLTVAPITIVARVHRAPTGDPLTPAAEPLPDIGRMNCGEWRNLQMGSGRVQTCE